MKHEGYTKIDLVFSNITEFKFHYTHIYNFYNVENSKLLNSDDYIYISSDPDTSGDKKSNDDSDFILAKKLELFIAN